MVAIRRIQWAGLILVVPLCLGSTYVVRPGDTLSHIAQRRLGNPVYGNRGSVQRLLDLNPQVRSKDLIYPGQVIFLDTPTREVAVEPEMAAVSENTASSTKEALPTQSPTKSPQALLPTTSISFAPVFSFLQLKGKEKLNGTSATLNSSLNYGVQAHWAHHWSDSFQTQIGLELKRVQIEPSATREISGDSQTYGGVEVGSRWNSKSASFLFATGMAQNLFYRASSITTLAVERAAIPWVSLGASYNVAVLPPLSFVAGINGIYSFSSSTDAYDIDRGFGYEANLSVQQQLKEKKLEGAVFHKHSRQDTSFLERRVTEQGLVFKYIWVIKNE